MNGWPRFIVIFLQSNRYLWLRAVTFLLLVKILLRLPA